MLKQHTQFPSECLVAGLTSHHFRGDVPEMSRLKLFLLSLSVKLQSSQRKWLKIPQPAASSVLKKSHSVYFNFMIQSHTVHTNLPPVNHCNFPVVIIHHSAFTCLGASCLIMKLLINLATQVHDLYLEPSFRFNMWPCCYTVLLQLTSAGFQRLKTSLNSKTEELAMFNLCRSGRFYVGLNNRQARSAVYSHKVLLKTQFSNLFLIKLHH